jgi:hypothetical protein
MPLTMKDNRANWDKLQANMKAGGADTVAVGFIDGVNEERKDGGPTNAELGAWHEFGVPGHVVERSFIRATTDKKRESWFQLAGKLAALVIDGKITFQVALGRLGERQKADIQNFMRAGEVEPGLETATLFRKKSHDWRPLIDTGQLLRAVTYAVRKGGG